MSKDPGASARPNRCQASGNKEQCVRDAIDGSRFCNLHRGNTRHDDAAKRRMYNLTQAKKQEKLGHFADHEDVKSLREEIAITRMLIEQRFNTIEDDGDLLAAVGGLNKLLITAEKLVKSSHVIEQNLGSLLAKSSVLVMGRQIVEVIVEELEGIPGYEDIVDRISERILTTILEQKDKE